MKKETKVNCEVENCKYNDSKLCDLDELDISCTCNNDECKEKEETICKSFEKREDDELDEELEYDNYDDETEEEYEEDEELDEELDKETEYADEEKEDDDREDYYEEEVTETYIELEEKEDF